MKKRRLLFGLRRDTMAWSLISVFLLMIAAAAVFLLLPRLAPSTTLRLGDGVFTAKMVDKVKGETVRSSELRTLSQNEALLFSYHSDDWWPVEVKRNTRSLDVVWLDKNKTVVHIVKNISTDLRHNTTFSPSKSARYVVELPMGTVEDRAIAIGASAVFGEEERASR